MKCVYWCDSDPSLMRTSVDDINIHHAWYWRHCLDCVTLHHATSCDNMILCDISLYLTHANHMTDPQYFIWHLLLCLGCLKYFDRWGNISTTRGSFHFKLYRDLQRCLTNIPVFFFELKRSISHVEGLPFTILHTRFCSYGEDVKHFLKEFLP